jgi:predicted dienelactone hydrolase
MAVAMATLMFGALSLAQEAQPEPTPEPKPESKPDPSKAPEGTLKVARVDDIKLADEARKKELVVSAVFPEAEGKYPVIFFSHGANAQSNSGTQLAEYWASHGYVVLSPKHADGRKSQADQLFEQYDADKDGKLSKEEVPEQMQSFFDTLDKNEDGFLTKDEIPEMSGRGGRGNRGRGNRGGQEPEQPEKPKEPVPEGEDEFDGVSDPAEMLLEDPAQPEPEQPRGGQGRQGRGRGFTPPALDAKAGVERVADIKLVLDNTEALVKAAPALKGKLDLEKVAVAGHNAGAYTAELIGGASVNVEETVKAEDGTESKKTENRNLADARVKAILALSPAGADQGGLTKDSFKGLKLPVMTVTGSKDTTGEKQDATWKKQAFELAPEGGKYHILIDGASNYSFTQPPRSFRGRGGEQPATDNTFEWVKTSTLMFWNSTLKGDEAARTWLSGDSLKEMSAGKATLERK